MCSDVVSAKPGSGKARVQQSSKAAIAGRVIRDPFIYLSRRFIPRVQHAVFRDVLRGPVFGVAVLALGKGNTDHSVLVPRNVPEKPAIRLHQESMALQALYLAGETSVGLGQFDASLNVLWAFGRQVAFDPRGLHHGAVFHAHVDRDVVAVAEIGEFDGSRLGPTAAERHFAVWRHARSE